MSWIRGLALVACLVGAVICPEPASASIITLDPAQTSFSGVFLGDDDVALLTFVLTVDTTISASTTSAAGGGFDTYLALFDAAGKFLLDNDDPPAGGRDAQLLTGDTASPLIPLLAGTYTLALAQSPNLANLTLAEGFFFQNDPTFTKGLFGADSPCASFVDITGACRTGAFAGTLTITEQAAPVPEPGTLALLATGLGVVAARRRHR